RAGSSAGACDGACAHARVSPLRSTRLVLVPLGATTQCSAAAFLVCFCAIDHFSCTFRLPPEPNLSFGSGGGALHAARPCSYCGASKDFGSFAETSDAQLELGSRPSFCGFSPGRREF